MNNDLKRYVLTKDNRIIDFSKYSISSYDKEKDCWVEKELNYINRITSIKGLSYYDMTYQDYLNLIKAQSDNVYELIEEGDLIQWGETNNIAKIVFDNPIYTSDFISIELFDLLKENNSITAIYKPDSKGNFIKVWEREK